LQRWAVRAILAARVSETVSNVYRDRGAASVRAGRAPVLHVLLHAWRPGLVTSRHRLDDVDVVELGRGEAGVERLVDGGRRRLRVRVADPRMSSEHGRLERRADGWLLDDPRSKNGAVVAGRPTRGARVRPGEVFELGHTLFLLADEPIDDGPLDRRSDELDDAVGGQPTFDPALQRELAVLARVATSAVPVLITGETGTGKELCARRLHAASGRSGPLIAVNCGGLAPQLIEAELFGHRKGAFSGALADRPGYLREAAGGTLFLDAIGDLPAAGQAALLRALQEHAVVPVGDARPIAIELRVCAATHRDLPAMVRAGAFREDLYARLLGVTVRLPPLRERRGDLGLLIARLLARTPGGAAASLTPVAAYALCTHDWPLNVRELERALAAAVARAGGAPIDVDDLPPGLGHGPGVDDAARSPVAPAAMTVADDDATDPALRAKLLAGLARHDGNVAALARELGKHREQVHRLLRRLGIDLAAFKR
jgi:DNA-binding NtrC family response regulator